MKIGILRFEYLVMICEQNGEVSWIARVLLKRKRRREGSKNVFGEDEALLM